MCGMLLCSTGRGASIWRENHLITEGYAAMATDMDWLACLLLLVGYRKKPP